MVLPFACNVTLREWHGQGYPTLSKRHQAFILQLLANNVQLVLTGCGRHFPSHNEGNSGVPVPTVQVNEDATQTSAFEHPLYDYLQYLSFLYRKQTPPSEQELVERSYRDYLQAPLQPLMDNLESQTYETFEKDDMKYLTYQHAVEACLLDRVPEAQAATTETLIMVVRFLPRPSQLQLYRDISVLGLLYAGRLMADVCG